jgi:hypothetical protein
MSGKIVNVTDRLKCFPSLGVGEPFAVRFGEVWGEPSDPWTWKIIAGTGRDDHDKLFFFRFGSSESEEITIDDFVMLGLMPIGQGSSK